MRILCVTPNVAVDRRLNVPGFAADGVWRATDVQTTPGGKGLNVARALRRLGQEVRCAGMLGGIPGRHIAVMADAEGLDGDWTWIEGQTRTTVIVVDDIGRTTVINEPGPDISAEEWQRFLADVASLARRMEAVCICGSLPPGVPTGALAELIETASDGGRRPVWVDTSGAALQQAVSAAPAGIKINADEAGALLGRGIGAMHDAMHAARDIMRRGPRQVAITLGAGGAVLASHRGDWHAWPPGIQVVDAVGSGDCFLAGLIAGMAEGVTAAEALRLATACGAANAMRPEAAMIDARDLTRLMVHTEVRLVTG